MIRRLAVALGALGLVSCFQYRERATIYPDGSGKIEVSVGYLIGDEDEVIQGLGSTVEGIVAWTEPVRRRCSDCGAYRYVTLTGYFEDLNAVRFFEGEGEERRQVREVHWVPLESADGYELTASIPEDTWEQGESDRGDRGWADLARPLLETAEVTVRLVLPGVVRQVEGFERVEDRVVQFRLRGPELAREGLPTRFRVLCGSSALTDEQLAEWREEFRRATGREER